MRVLLPDLTLSGDSSSTDSCDLGLDAMGSRGRAPYAQSLGIGARACDDREKAGCDVHDDYQRRSCGHLHFPDGVPMRKRRSDEDHGGSQVIFATVADLLGDWPYSYRVLHPVAAGMSGRGQRPGMRWSEVAEQRATTVELSSAQWHDVSGRRLHTTAPAAEDFEPEVGPATGVLIPLLRLLAAETAEVDVAEWDGYGSVKAGRALDGAVRRPDRQVGRENFTVWRMPPHIAERLIQAGSETATMGSDAVLANLIEGPDDQWLVRADGDLASTYVGSRTALIHWPTSLERCSVDPGDPLG